MWDMRTVSTARPLPALVSSGPSAELSLYFRLEATINANQGPFLPPHSSVSVSVQQGGESWAGWEAECTLPPALRDTATRRLPAETEASIGSTVLRKARPEWVKRGENVKCH